MALLPAFLIHPYYDSYVQLMPPNMSNQGAASMLASMAGGSNAAAIEASDFLGIKSNGAIYIGVLNSRTVADDVINKFNLRKYYHTKMMADTRVRLAADTSTNEDRKSGIISIRVRMQNPQLAADVANCYAEELDSVLIRNNTTSAHRQRLFLEQRLKSVKADLETATQQLSQYSSKSMMLEPAEQARAMLQGEATLRSQLIMAETELESLKQIYTPQEVQKLPAQAQVNELKSQLRGFEHGSDSAASSLPSLGELPITGARYADLYRHVKLQEAIFNILTQQYELAKMNEAKEVPSVQFLDKALPAEKKSGPSRRAIVLVGAGFGLLLGLGFESSKDLWSDLPAEHPIKATVVSMRTHA